MPTPKFDKLCTEFIKRIPTQLQTAFVEGAGLLPDAYDIGSIAIVDYVNRALKQLFNVAWQNSKGLVQPFISVFPELHKISASVTIDGSGEYAIASPYKDFYKIIGAISTDGTKYMKPKEENLYLFFLSGKYKSYKATANDPAIFQIGEKLIVIPNTAAPTMRFHYVKQPLDPLTGNALTQNGLTDSPFDEMWNNEIVDLAYKKFLEETIQTSETVQTQ